MLIQQHHEIITFDVFGLATHNVILNIPWLKNAQSNNKLEEWNIHVPSGLDMLPTPNLYADSGWR